MHTKFLSENKVREQMRDVIIGERTISLVLSNKDFKVITNYI
jgi:hypothetical protein